ncbi:hypothetical protein PV10_05132 [Exophiala mesophila]|uniref:ATPase expression protein 2, mitochondrial n=1 Tax=Exophiala mesophila TaxID=212818 RepID=A0A0D1ZH44_EXOME|nr:uncharacterized protein PV10_05132 [Exophiala mesophila]KIV93962.1 hypothetical protein PV10_05132 [Exophiala mesophila]
MRGSRPLTRIINGSQQPASRIPHLRLHIVRHNSSSIQRKESWRSAFSPPQRSSQLHPTDTSSWPSASRAHPHTPRSYVSTPATTHSEQDVRPSMEDLIAENDPERIFFGFINPDIGLPFIRNASDEAFAQAFSALDPEHFIVPFREIHHYLRRSLETQPVWRVCKSLEERISTFTLVLNNLLRERQEAGFPATLALYRHQLRCAAACGDGTTARHLFYDLMPIDEVKPDLECYNLLMEAVTWNNAYSHQERYHLRVTRQSLNFRSRDNRAKNYAGWGVASPHNPENPQSVRFEVLRIFNELVRDGFTANEATFCHLMVAMGREGDIPGVKSVLKSAWNIDVDSLETIDEEELESPTFYENDSPLRPSQRLLFTIAHVFCTNNEITNTTMLLDYISRHYNMEISRHVWNHTLEWAFVLFTNGTSWFRKQGRSVGRPTGAAVESLFGIVLSEPYEFQLGVIPLIYRLKVRTYKRVLTPALEDARECLQLLDKERMKLSVAFDNMSKLAKGSWSGLFEHGLPTREFLQARRELILQELWTECYIQLVIVSTRSMFKESEWPGSGKETEWPRRGLPNLVREFPEFLPDVVPYYTETGHVLLHGKETRREAVSASNGYQLTRTARMRNLLDTFSPARLEQSARILHEGRMMKMKAREAERIRSERVDWIAGDEIDARQDRLQSAPTRVKYSPSADNPQGQWRPWQGPPLPN